MGEVLSYPLTFVPLSLCHVDGSIHKSPKSAVLNYLESKIASNQPDRIDVTIIDAMFFLHLYSNLPLTFGGVAGYLLARILEVDGEVVHFIFDKWKSPSIKDSERDSRLTATESIPYEIKGANQKRPISWLSALRNSTFKESLMHFLVKIWRSDEHARLFNSKTLYVNCNDICYKFYTCSDSVICDEVPELYCTHEEADSRMFFHLGSIQSPSNVIIRTAGTDCLIIALACRLNYDTHIKVWIEVGTYSKNNQRYISIDDLHSHLGPDLCKALPTYHALTGSDYTASFSRRGKVKPLKILEKSTEYQSAFIALAEDSEIKETTLNKIEGFVCTI